MMTSDLFKSYDPGWLRASDFESMTAWLGTISTSEPTIDAEHVTDVADWRARLRERHLPRLISGTSGRPSFVARDMPPWTALRRNGEVYARLPLDDVAPGSLDLLALTPRGMALGDHALPGAWPIKPLASIDATTPRQTMAGPGPSSSLMQRPERAGR